MVVRARHGSSCVRVLLLSLLVGVRVEAAEPCSFGLVRAFLRSTKKAVLSLGDPAALKKERSIKPRLEALEDRTLLDGSSPLVPVLTPGTSVISSQTVVDPATTTSNSLSDSRPTVGSSIQVFTTIGIPVPGASGKLDIFISQSPSLYPYTARTTLLSTTTVSGSGTVHNTQTVTLPASDSGQWYIISDFQPTTPGYTESTGSSPIFIALFPTGTGLSLASGSATQVGQPLSFDVTVQTIFPFLTPNGTVTVSAAGIGSASGTLSSIGPGTSRATVTFPGSSLSAGTFSFTAYYAGDGNRGQFADSTSQPDKVTIAPAPTPPSPPSPSAPVSSASTTPTACMMLACPTPAQVLAFEKQVIDTLFAEDRAAAERFLSSSPYNRLGLQNNQLFVDGVALALLQYQLSQPPVPPTPAQVLAFEKQAIDALFCTFAQDQQEASRILSTPPFAQYGLGKYPVFVDEVALILLEAQLGSCMMP